MRHRSSFDYLRYYNRFHKKELAFFLINLVLFGFLLYESGNTFSQLTKQTVSWKELTVSLLKTALAVFNIVWSVIGLRRDWKEDRKNDEHNVRISRSFRPAEIQAPQGWEKAPENASGEYAVFSPKVNRYLISHEAIPMKIKEDDFDREKVCKFIMQHRSVMFEFLNERRADSKDKHHEFFNEEKLCLTSDLMTEENSPASCHRGTYFSAYLTNLCCKKELYGQDEMVVFDGYDYYPAADNVLQPLSFTSLCNNIGISTVGITDDRYLVLWVQNFKTQGNNGRLVPSGSGSCDWADRKHGGKKKADFAAVIRYAMQRELWEESGKKALSDSPDKIGTTRIIGFFRWLEKGGAPEFTGVTRMHCRIEDVTPDDAEVCNKDGKEPQHILISDCTAQALLDAIDKLMTRSDICLPLYMNLLFLKQWILAEDLPEPERNDAKAERLSFLFP